MHARKLNISAVSFRMINIYMYFKGDPTTKPFRTKWIRELFF